MAKRTVRTKPPASSPVATAGAGCRADSTTHDLASWAYGNGDKMADELEYVPLPAALKEMVRKSWTANIKDGSGKPVGWK